VATGAAWLKGRNSQAEERDKTILTGRKNKRKNKNMLDSYRPSHGRSFDATSDDGRLREVDGGLGFQT
jgi:hypothetical protein